MQNSNTILEVFLYGPPSEILAMPLPFYLLMEMRCLRTSLKRSIFCFIPSDNVRDTGSTNFLINTHRSTGILQFMTT